MKMKKKLLILSAIILFFVGGIVLAQDKNEETVINKFECYGFSPTKGDIAYWKNLNKVNQYGSLEKNLERRFLQTRVARVDENDKFICVNTLGGAFLPSRFKTTLSLGLSSGLTPAGNYFISLSSKTTFDGHVLTTSDFGIATSTNTIPIHINPSGSTDEIAICKGISPTTTAMVDCTRGYNFYNNETSSDNVNVHSSGESVIISNDTHFIANQYVPIYGNKTIFGKITVSTTTEATMKLYFGDNNGGYIWYNTTTDQLGYATSTTEFAFNSSGTQFTAVNPMTLLSGELRVATSSYDFILRDNLFAISSSTISNGTASGKAIDDLFNARYNATTTKESITLNNFTTVNATSTGSTYGFTFFGGNQTDGATTTPSTQSSTSTNQTYTEIFNFSSWEIPTSSVWTFGSNWQNKLVRIKVKGNCKINGKLKLDGLGGVGGAGGTTASGSIGIEGFAVWNFDQIATTTAGGIGNGEAADGGGGGGGGSNCSKGTKGSAATGASVEGKAGAFLRSSENFLRPTTTKSIFITTGSGGGGGGTGSAGSANDTGGAGGNGGGALYIECLGDIHFGSASEIHLQGNKGSNGTNQATVNRGGGAGGGGSGGQGIILYNGSKTDLGLTVFVNGGTGGTGGTNDGGNGGNGGTGRILIGQNTEF